MRVERRSQRRGGRRVRHTVRKGSRGTPCTWAKEGGKSRGESCTVKDKL